MKGALLAATLAYGVYGDALNGDPNCPCTGDISKIPDGQQNKEIGYGTDCRPWDQGMSYCTEHKTGNKFDEGYEWCALEWCYVDRDVCDGALVTLDDGAQVDPQVAQSVIYPTVELYYSYNTCGNLDLFENSGTVWVWDFGECEDRTANDYYLLIDGSKSVEGEWDGVISTMQTITKEGMNVDGDRIGMVEFSGKRAFDVSDTVTVFDFEDDTSARENKINEMKNLQGQTWTLMGIQQTLALWDTKTDLNTDDRRKILALVTDGRPKPRTTASDAPGDTAEPGCIDTMIDTDLRICDNGESPGVGKCRNENCNDVNMATTDCCPGDQNPCTSDELDSLLQTLKDGDILIAVIAVGKDAANMKSEPYDCEPTDCTPGGRTECNCKYDIYYFDCLIKPDYDQNADPIPHRITTIADFSSFFQYKDPTASTEGGTDGQLCIDPKVLLPPAPPTNACTEIPEPKDVVLILDSSKSMYTTKQRGNTARENWLTVMEDLQGVVCLYNSQADAQLHRCAFTTRDNVGLVRFATRVKVEHDFNLPNQLWWSYVKFTKLVNGVREPNLDRKELNYMTDTVAALWEGFNMMERKDPATVLLQNGDAVAKRREIILITDGRPHCKRDKETLCRPCSPTWKEETLLKEQLADAELKIVWRGDRNSHDGSITVDKDQLADDGWFGCLRIDFDDTDQFVLVENFHEDVFRAALIGNTVCAQDQ